jgi:hypothetical protein
MRLDRGDSFLLSGWAAGLLGTALALRRARGRRRMQHDYTELQREREPHQARGNLMDSPGL